MYIVTAGGWLPSTTPPSGWTLTNGVLGLYWQWAVYRKVASGTYGVVSPEAGNTVTLTYTGGAFDVQSSIVVVDTQGATTSPVVTGLYTTTSVLDASTQTLAVRRGELIVYVGSGRANRTVTITLSRGTTLNTRSADTNSGSVLGTEVTTSNSSVSQTYTPNVAGTGNRGRMYFALIFNQPFSDTFAGAGELRQTATISNLDTTAWSTEANEPGGLDKTGWVTFIPSTTTRYVFSTAGSNFDTVMNLYTGNTLDTLALVANDDDSGGSGTSQITQESLTAGTTYYIQVGAKSGGSGGLLSFRADQYAMAQLTSTHTEYATNGAPESRLTSAHIEVVSDGAGSGGGKSEIRLTSTYIEILTPMKKAFEGWSQPL